jgi:hypothetical protein
MFIKRERVGGVERGPLELLYQEVIAWDSIILAIDKF